MIVFWVGNFIGYLNIIFVVCWIILVVVVVDW